LHTRIDDRVEKITTRLKVGNIYVNRNQIGAIVGTQPFGGENLSGTGPKAGGPHYVKRFTSEGIPSNEPEQLANSETADVSKVQQVLSQLPDQRKVITSSYLPGPTGESNKLSVFPIGRVLCLGPTVEMAIAQARVAQQVGCEALIVCPGAQGENAIDGFLPRVSLSSLKGFSAVICNSGKDDLRQIRIALAERKGALVPLVVEQNIADRCVIERHVCIDTTAAGGNVSLLASLA